MMNRRECIPTTLPNFSVDNAPSSSQKAKVGPQSMFDAFKKWSLLGHTFTFVKLTPEEVKSLGAATRQFLEPDGDVDSGTASVRERRRILIAQPEFVVRVPESTRILDPIRRVDHELM